MSKVLAVAIVVIQEVNTQLSHCSAARFEREQPAPFTTVYFHFSIKANKSVHPASRRAGDVTRRVSQSNSGSPNISGTIATRKNKLSGRSLLVDVNKLHWRESGATFIMKNSLKLEGSRIYGIPKNERTRPQLQLLLRQFFLQKMRKKPQIWRLVKLIIEWALLGALFQWNLSWKGSREVLEIRSCVRECKVCASRGTAHRLRQTLGFLSVIASRRKLFDQRQLSRHHVTGSWCTVTAVGRPRRLNFRLIPSSSTL